MNSTTYVYNNHNYHNLIHDNFTFDNLTYFNLTYNDISCDVELSITGIIIQILYSLLFIAGITGNSIVIYTILRYACMKTATNWYILNLAIADDCFLFGIPFLVTTMNLKDWIFGNFMCKIYMIMTGVNQVTSSFFLVIMSIDRYLAVCHPMSCLTLRSPFTAKIVMFTVWPTAMFFMLPVFFYANTSKDLNKNGKWRISCNIFWPNDRIGHNIFISYTFILSFLCPLILIVTFYSLVIKRLRTVGPANKSKQKKQANQRVNKMVFSVIIVYICCWTPYWISQLTLLFTPPGVCQSSLAVVCFLIVGFLSYSNSALNPILYAFLSDNFNKSFQKVCPCLIGEDVNTYVNENSVIVRRNQADRRQLCSTKQFKLEFDDEEGVRGETSTSSMIMMSRSNITIINPESRERNLARKNLTKNDRHLILSTEV